MKFTDTDPVVIDGTRFGTIEVPRDRLLHFEAGLLGLPGGEYYALLEREGQPEIGYLQSVEHPERALPIAGGSLFGTDYPQPDVHTLAAEHGLVDADPVVVVVVVARPEEALLEANMLAPIIIDTNTRRGVQVVLDPKRYAVAAPLALRPVAAGENLKAAV